MKQGLIRGISTFYGKKELKESFANYQVINVHRFTKLNNNVREPREIVALTLASGLLRPEGVFLGFQSLRVVKLKCTEKINLLIS